MKKLSFIYIALFFLLLFSSCTNEDLRVIVAGSTSVQPYAEILAEEFNLLHPDIIVDIQGGGSSAGIMAARSDTADIGMTSRSLEEDESDLWIVEIANDGLAIIINPKNDITDLTTEQIRDIYTQKIKTWDELDPEKGNSSKIHIISREEGSGTRSAFVDLVMGDQRISLKSIVQGSNGAIKQIVSGDVNAIGFISLGMVDDSVKALKLNGVAATGENVKNGAYMLMRPFLFVTKNEPEGIVLQFIEYILSPEGSGILIKEGLIP